MLTSTESLGAEGRFIEDLNDIPIGVGKVERTAAIAMRAGWVAEWNLTSSEGGSRTVHIFWRGDQKAQMIEPLPGSGDR